LVAVGTTAAGDTVYELRDAMTNVGYKNVFDFGYLSWKAMSTADFSSIEKMIPEPESGLLSGLLLGSKKALSDEWVERFRASGLVHMVVLSGYNITIVADSIIKFFSFLPVFVSNIFAVFGILAFALMTGATPTTVRASIMALVAIFSRHTGRTYLAGRALIFAGFVMVLNNPKILAFDFSFQLSFLATVAIILLSPKIKDYLNFVTEKFGLREIVASTLATQIFVAPLLLFRSGQLSILSLPIFLGESRIHRFVVKHGKSLPKKYHLFLLSSLSQMPLTGCS
jgi:ComEC/Rec2-related protein